MPMINDDDGDEPLSKQDRAALELAMKLIRTESPGRAEQIDSMLEDRPWQEVAEFAVYCLQIKSLRLKPSEHPPLHADEDGDEELNQRAGPEGVALLKRMLACGVSRWHPDPIAACEAAEKARGGSVSRRK
jgi:hypothetical protein